MQRALTLALSLVPALALAACGATVPPRPDTIVAVPPSTRIPEFEISATFSPAPSVAPAPVEVPLRVGLIASGDDGRSGEKVGCGDSLVFVERFTPVASDSGEPLTPGRILTETMAELLGLQGATYSTAQHENSLVASGSSLAFERAELDPDGTATVRITGRVVSRGVCDLPRIREQLEGTARAVQGVSRVVVLLNGSETAWTCSFDQSGLPPCDAPPADVQ